MKDAIRLGDSTTHGGKVLEAFSRTDLSGVLLRAMWMAGSALKPVRLRLGFGGQNSMRKAQYETFKIGTYYWRG